MSYGIVYLALSRTSGKGYVGQTTQDLQARWRSHKCGQCHALRAAIRKYGVDDFDLSVLAEAADRDELDRLEIEFIAKQKTLSPEGYNIETGGANGKPTSQARQRMSLAHQGVPLSDDHRAAMVQAQRNRREHEAATGGGPVFTPASREAMRGAKLGTTHSDETKAKMSASQTGRTPTEATREKLRKAASGKVQTPETRRKIREAQQGREHSDETKAKMSLTRTGRKRPAEVMEKTAAKNRGKKRTPEQKERMRQARLAYLTRKREATV
jgi:group I intron endonuclease